VPLSALALLLGLAGVVTAGASHKTSLRLPAAGSAVSGAVVVVALLFPALLGNAYRAYREKANQDSTGVTAIPLLPRPQEETGLEESGWVDGSRAAVQQDHVRVMLTGVAVGPVELKTPSKKQPTREKFLTIRLRIQHVGAAREFPYPSWNEPAPGNEKSLPTLTDNTGKVYRRKSFDVGVEVVGQVRRASVFPGTFVEDLLVFEAPPAGVEFLHLELPVAAWGGDGVFRLAIPKSMIRR
jgi:hypothetical protein